MYILHTFPRKSIIAYIANGIETITSGNPIMNIIKLLSINYFFTYVNNYTPSQGILLIL